MNWPLLPPALETVLLAGTVMSCAAGLAYAFAVPDGTSSEWVMAAAVATPVLAAGSAFVRISRYRRLRQITGRLAGLVRMMDREDAARMSALLFESRHVCAEAVSVSRSLNDRKLYEAALGTQRKLEEVFGAVSSGMRPTSDNVREFQDQLRSLGRGMSDGPRHAGRKGGR